MFSSVSFASNGLSRPTTWSKQRAYQIGRHSAGTVSLSDDRRETRVTSFSAFALTACATYSPIRVVTIARYPQHAGRAAGALAAAAAYRLRDRLGAQYVAVARRDGGGRASAPSRERATRLARPAIDGAKRRRSCRLERLLGPNRVDMRLECAERPNGRITRGLGQGGFEPGHSPFSLGEEPMGQWKERSVFHSGVVHLRANGSALPQPRGAQGTHRDWSGSSDAAISLSIAWDKPEIRRRFAAESRLGLGQRVKIRLERMMATADDS